MKQIQQLYWARYRVKTIRSTDGGTDEWQDRQNETNMTGGGIITIFKFHNFNWNSLRTCSWNFDWWSISVSGDKGWHQIDTKPLSTYTLLTYVSLGKMILRSELWVELEPGSYVLSWPHRRQHIACPYSPGHTCELWAGYGGGGGTPTNCHTGMCHSIGSILKGQYP